MEFSDKSLRGIVYLLLILCLAGTANADDPNDLSGDTYYSFGTIEASGSCPSWFTALDRNSTDTHTTERLIVELDGCEVMGYEVYTMEQGAQTGVLADLEEDDIFVVWDEDAGHGSNVDFTFTNDEYVDITDDNSDYVQVSSIPNNILNWKVYRVTASGTLTVNSTGLNEHDAFHLELNLLDFEKTDNVSGNDCLVSGNEITYTICWDNTSDTTFEDANIIDYLPVGVEYDYIISYFPSLVKDPNYNEDKRTYTWKLGDIAPDDSGCVSLTVTVNEKAEPGMSLHNRAELWANPNILVARDTEDTLVCCWGDDPNMIYVDMTATGYDTGISWENAYSEEDALQKALRRADESKCEGPFTIYVAQGTYSPGNYGSDSFEVPEGSKVYGGFMTGGSIFSERNPDMYETVLTGYTFIDDDPNATTYYELNDTVVTMVNQYVSDPNFPVDETTLLDGFTVTDAVQYGIYGNGVDFTIVNCTVTDSEQYGIYALDGDVTVKWSKIENSGEDGIRHQGAGNTLTVENSQIIGNDQRGIYTQNSTPTIKNCVVFGNGNDVIDFEGIRIIDPLEVPILYNNTIVYNSKEGIYCKDDTNSEGDPNYPDYPDIRNSILYYNNDGGDQITIALPLIPPEYERDDYASYCDIQGSNGSNNNISAPPGFVHGIEESSTVNPYQYHLAYDSACKDMGDPAHDANDVGFYDIDGEDRLDNNRADIGADELYSCDDDLSEDDIYNWWDWDFDGIVNYNEFAVFFDMWLAHDPNDPGYSPDPEEYARWSKVRDYNFDKDGTSQYQIDVDDLMYLANDWAWIACWKQGQFDLSENMMEMAMGGGESMMIMPMAFGFTALPEEAEPEPKELSTAELVSLVEGIYGIIKYVDSVEKTHENAENLYDIKAFLEGVLREMQAER